MGCFAEVLVAIGHMTIKPRSNCVAHRWSLRHLAQFIAAQVAARLSRFSFLLPLDGLHSRGCATFMVGRNTTTAGERGQG